MKVKPKTKIAQAGVALVEFALVVPLLILLLIGLMEWGRLTYFSILVGNAAHAGVQYGAQDLSTAVDDPGMQKAATNDGQSVSGLTAQSGHTCWCYNGTTATSLSCTAAVTSCPAGYHRLVYVWVTATGSFNTLFNYGPLGLPSPWKVTRQAQMRVINQQQ